MIVCNNYFSFSRNTVQLMWFTWQPWWVVFLPTWEQTSTFSQKIWGWTKTVRMIRLCNWIYSLLVFDNFKLYKRAEQSNQLLHLAVESTLWKLRSRGGCGCGFLFLFNFPFSSSHEPRVRSDQSCLLSIHLHFPRQYHLPHRRNHGKSNPIKVYLILHSDPMLSKSLK